MNWCTSSTLAAASAPLHLERLVLDLRSAEAHSLKRKGNAFGLTHHSCARPSLSICVAGREGQDASAAEGGEGRAAGAAEGAGA